jgi:polar amino acid transport system substrate-binding protein
MRWMVLPWLLISLSASAQPGLTLLSHDLPPFTEYRDGKLDGFAIRLIDEVQEELGTRYPVRIYPLKRALALARVEPGYGLFVVQRLPERESHFKWVGPLFINRVFIYQAPDSRHPRQDGVIPAQHRQQWGTAPSGRSLYRLFQGNG